MKSNSDCNNNNNQRNLWEVVLSAFYESNPKDKRNSFVTRPTCDFCDVKDAVWENSVIQEYRCGDCVPRGCSCRLVKTAKGRKFDVEEYKYKLDETGAELPCEDWHKF